nr:hypothetical protein [uncultured Pseudomonas sp.]
MSPDYGVDGQVRLVRRWGRAITVLILLGLVLAMAWKIAQVSETRAMHATLEHLSASLNSLAAEHIAKDQVLDPAWSRKNPFVLLRWRQSGYCGELAAGAEPQNGCWYWLPAQAWVLYQARFSDGWSLGQGEMQAYRLVVLNSGVPTGSHLLQDVFALELEVVPATELAAQGWLSN